MCVSPKGHSQILRLRKSQSQKWLVKAMPEAPIMSSHFTEIPRRPEHDMSTEYMHFFILHCLFVCTIRLEIQKLY